MVPPTVVNFWLRIGKPRLTLSGHHAVTRAYRHGNQAVDVFLPSCGEPIELLDNTFHCVSKMRWHGTKTVYVLDDSAREAVRALAVRYGYRYVVRANRGELRKAGNLINAFGLSDGEFIVVLDADFAVRPDFLYEAMPYTADPKVGVVQTAQFFDTNNRSFSYIQRYSGALQEIFFRFIQPARDRYKAAICAGTNLIYRRSAVERRAGSQEFRSARTFIRGKALVGRLRDPLRATVPRQGSRTGQLRVTGQPADAVVPFVHATDARKAFPGGALHLETAGRILGGLPLLHVVGRPAVHRAVPDAGHDVVLPASGPPAQLPGDPAISRRDVVRVPDAEQRLATDHLSGLHHKFLLSSLRDLVCDPRTRRRVDTDRRIPWQGSGSHGSESHPARLDSGGADFAVVIGLVLRVNEFGWRPYWATLALSVYQSYHACTADHVHARKPTGGRHRRRAAGSYGYPCDRRDGSAW